MPHFTVMTVAEDQDGRLLFGTLGDGLATYNGRSFQVYTTEHGLPSNKLLSLQPQTDGLMRVLTDAGIGRFADGRCVECATDIAGQRSTWWQVVSYSEIAMVSFGLSIQTEAT